MNTPSTENGYVYIMDNGIGQLKIGHSINPSARLSQIKCGSPNASLRFISDMVSNRTEIEKECHKELHKYSTGGEWFNVDYQKAKEAVKRLTKNIGKEPNRENDDSFNDRFTECLLLVSGYSLKIAAGKDTGKQTIFAYIELIVKTGNKKHLDLFMEKRDFEQYLEAITFFSKQSLGFEG